MRLQTNLHMNSKGEGEPLVLLHGWGMHSDIWGAFADRLAEYYQVIRVDLPGHGNSKMVCSLSLAAVTEKLLQQLPETAHYIGWSLGGSILMHLGHKAPERVRSMTLLAANPCFVQQPLWPTAMQADVLQQFADALQQDYRRTLLQFIVLQTLSSEHAKTSLKQLRQSLFATGEPEPDALEQGLEILMQSDLRDSIKKINIPCQVVLGERDQLVPVGVADFYRHANEKINISVIQAAGHVPFISHPEQTLNDIKGFLNNVR